VASIISMNNIPHEVFTFTTRNADVCSFVLVSQLFGLALEADRHVSRLILQDVATRILHRVSRTAFEATIGAIVGCCSFNLLLCSAKKNINAI